jgi:hypothetical protein
MPRRTWAALLLLVAFGPVPHAQSTKVSLVGRITDRAKAVILEAKIAAVSARPVKTIWRRASGLHGRRTASLAESKFLSPSSLPSRVRILRKFPRVITDEAARTPRTNNAPTRGTQQGKATKVAALMHVLSHSSNI